MAKQRLMLLLGVFCILLIVVGYVNLNSSPDVTDTAPEDITPDNSTTSDTTDTTINPSDETDNSSNDTSSNPLNTTKPETPQPNEEGLLFTKYLRNKHTLF